jgi:GT2 family glycosyltransferase
MKNKDYNWWRKKNNIQKRDLVRQKKSIFELKPKFSIIIPIEYADKKKIKKIIEFLQQQSYENWELCLSIRCEAKVFDYDDDRVKVIESRKNLSMVGGINHALEFVTGEFIMIIQENDELEFNALYECVKLLNCHPEIEFIYTDEDCLSVKGKKYTCPHFKSDFNLDLLRSMNYIGHLYVVKKDLQKRVGLFCEEMGGEYEYDFILRCIEKSESIWHIPKVLYHKKESKKQIDNIDKRKQVVEEHLKRCQEKATVEIGKRTGICRVRYQLDREPFISIIVPNKDHVDDLNRCIQSIYRISDYSNFEILIIENGSDEKRTFEYYRNLLGQHKNIKVIFWNKSGEFNYSALNNYGVKSAEGEYLLFLNNDTEIINKNCISEMVSHAVRGEVGAVGAKLYYPNGTIQHAGVILGLGGIAGHAFCGLENDLYSYFLRSSCIQDYSAVTAACMMMPKTLFEEIGGFEENLKVAFNDVDLCMKIRKKGKMIVYTPYARLYHYESKSRGIEDTEEKKRRFLGEVDYFAKKWKHELEKGDPYYNPNLTLERNDFSLRIV